MDVERALAGQLPGQTVRQLGLPGPWVSREQQRALQDQRHVDRVDQPRIGPVGGGMVIDRDFGFGHRPQACLFA